MRKLAIVVALASTSLATHAFARDGAWYVGVEGGGMLIENSKFDITNSLGTKTNDAFKVRTHIGYDFDGIVGYDLGMFRIEGEVGYKRAEVDEVRNSGYPLPIQGNGVPPTDYSSAAFNWRGARGSDRALSGMINALLDFGDEGGLAAYVGGGAGIARVKTDALRVTNASPVFLTDSDTKFAWQAIAGVRYPLTSNIDVGVKYRFFNVPNVKMATFYQSEAKTKWRSHSVLASLVYNFGEPTPPPPPPEQPAPPPPPPPPPADVPPPPPPVAQNVGPFIVFFDWNKSTITPEAASILDNAAAAFAQGAPTSIMLAGYADTSGTARYNVGLSQRRADAVKAYLAGKGVSESALTTQAYGETKLLVQTADGVREPQNRRVEITAGPGSGM